MAVLAGVVLSAAPACGGLRSGGTAAAKELPGIRAAARSLVGHADDAANRGGVAPDIADDLSRRTDELSRYRASLTSEDRRLAASLQTLRSATLEIQAAQAAADAAAQLADAEASSIARAAIRGDRVAGFVADVEAVTKDVVKSTGCDLVANVLLPSERTSVAADRPTVAPSARTVANAVINRLSVRWRLTDVQASLDWTAWAEGVVGAARKVAKAPPGNVELTSTIHSRAFYYYVRICHALPG